MTILSNKMIWRTTTLTFRYKGYCPCRSYTNKFLPCISRFISWIGLALSLCHTWFFENTFSAVNYSNYIFILLKALWVIPLNIFPIWPIHDSSRARKLIQVTNILETRAWQTPNLNSISCSGRPTRNLRRVKNKHFLVTN